MPREINEKQRFADKLVKFIPTEIIGAYMALASFLGYGPISNITPVDEVKSTLIQIMFVILLIMTPIYLTKVSGVRNRLQLFISTISFIVWVYTLGGPFIVWKFYHPDISSSLLVLWSLVPPIFVKANVAESMS
jgi:hypothetical protein